MTRKAAHVVHLIPTGDYHIPGVPAVECDVDEAYAAELLAYRPPAFIQAPPDEAAEPTEAPEIPGPSDSAEE